MPEASSVARIFSEHFRQAPDFVVFAPGLVNLMGEHTDYNQGLQILSTLNLGVWAGVSLRADQQLHLACNYFPDEPCSWELCGLVAQDSEFDWSNILRSLTEQLYSRFSLPRGLNIYLHCQLPASAGFSLIYSLLYATATALLKANQQPYAAKELAHVCWEVKRKHGRLDPTDAKPWVIATGQAGFAYLHDAQQEQLTPLTINPCWKFFVIDLGEPKQFLDSAIAQRTVQCRTAAHALGVDHLRQIDLAQLEHEQGNLEDIIYKRARHVVTENIRCQQLIQLLSGTDMDGLAHCWAQSQLSLRQDYDVTTERLDRWVDQLKSTFGDSLAVRLNGGGFGGSLVLITNRLDSAVLQAEVKAVLPDIKLLPVQPAAVQLSNFSQS